MLEKYILFFDYNPFIIYHLSFCAYPPNLIPPKLIFLCIRQISRQFRQNLFPLIAWKLKSKGKLLADVAGYIPKEISRAAWFSLEREEKINGTAFEVKHRPFPIPKGGLKIMLFAGLRYHLIEDKKEEVTFLY